MKPKNKTNKNKTNKNKTNKNNTKGGNPSPEKQTQNLMNLTNNIDNYLINVKINSNTNILEIDIKNKLKEKLFENKSNLNIMSKITLIISKLQPKQTWVDCKKDCFDILLPLINKEINSTAYILRVLTESVIPETVENKPKVPFEFTGTLNDITGLWANDSQYFKLHFGESSTKKTRLILGLGPSASGKTYCAESIIKLLSKTDNSFPTEFMTVDGGTYRKYSLIYQLIVLLLKNYNYLGLTNLVSASVFSTLKSLFNSNYIKKLIIKYLKLQPPISLYVPETLGDCGQYRDIKTLAPINNSCYLKYKDFIDITGDKNWIAFLIWQHKTGIDCIYPDKYKCMGCTESGKLREIDEGKKYSNSAWSHSFIEGKKVLMNAPGGRYEIHSSGGKKINGIPCKNTIIDYSTIPLYNKNPELFNTNLNEFNFKINKLEYQPISIIGFDNFVYLQLHKSHKMTDFVKNKTKSNLNFFKSAFNKTFHH